MNVNLNNELTQTIVIKIQKYYNALLLTSDNINNKLTIHILVIKHSSIDNYKAYTLLSNEFKTRNIKSKKNKIFINTPEISIVITFCDSNNICLLQR